MGQLICNFFTQVQIFITEYIDLFLIKINQKSKYSFKSLPFFEEDEKGLVLCDDFIMDEFDEEFMTDAYGSDKPTPIDEGSIKALTVDEIKQMKPQKPVSYDSLAFKNSLDN